MGSKQYLVAIATIFIELEILGHIKNAYIVKNYNLSALYFSLALFIGLSVYVCIRNEIAWYRVTNRLDFISRWIFKYDFIYKYDTAKTSDQQLSSHVRVRDINVQNGGIWFNKTRTYGTNYCNIGYVMLLTSVKGATTDEFNDIMLTLVYSFVKGSVNKIHHLTSKNKTDLAAAYENMLKENLNPWVRSGIYELKKYIQTKAVKNGSSCFITVGVGYYTTQQKDQAYQDVEQSIQANSLFFRYAGIESRVIKSEQEYQVLYRQFFKMDNTGVLTVE